MKIALLFQRIVYLLLGCSVTAALSAETYQAACKKPQDAAGNSHEVMVRTGQPYTYAEAKELCAARNLPLDYISRPGILKNDGQVG